MRPERAVRSITRVVGLALAAACLVTPEAPMQGQSFTDISAGLTEVHHGTSVWGDFDQDSQLDALLTGQRIGGSYFADIFQNSGGSFSSLGAGLTAVGSGNGTNRGAWGDFDNDGDLDVVITGISGGGLVTELYQNNSGSFSQMTITGSPFIGVAFSSVAWGDFDNDGDLDLFVTGYGSGNQRVATVYRNDGPNGSAWEFTDIDPLPGATITKVGWSDGAWGDYDKDGDMDLIVTGYTLIGINPSTRLYRNDGGTLVPAGSTGLLNLGQGSVAWGDCNNDGWLDLAITGFDQNGQRNFRIYLNNGSTVSPNPSPLFQQSASYQGVSDGSVAWGDYNNDGNLDLVVTGLYATSTPMAKVYRGNGNGTLTEDLNGGLVPVYQSQAVWGDYDNDGRLDILLSGRGTGLNDIYSRVYRNTTGVSANTPPSAPTNLNYAANSRAVAVSWNPATDAESPQAALTYNLSIYDQTAGEYKMTPMADPGSGTRWVPAFGNMNHRTNWLIKDLIPGHTYEICVQAIDQGFAASSFTCWTLYTPASGHSNMMIGDCGADVGNEPNGNCGSVLWNSPNIWVRNNNDGVPTHQSPLSGQTNYVNIRLTNLGPGIVLQGTVHLYYAKASTGLSWPTSWTGNYINGVPYGDYIGSYTVNNFVSAGTVVIPWHNVPDPSDYNDPDAHHFCLLARYVGPDDPMTFPEGPVIGTNTANNNNIAWKNVSIIDVDGPFAAIEIRNIAEADAMLRLELGIPEEERDDPILNYCKVKFEMEPKLFDHWQSAGGRGEGIEIADDDSEWPGVWITTPDAVLHGIPMGPLQQLTGRVRIIYPDFNDELLAKLAGRVFHLNLVEYDQESDMLIGGETYDIRMPGGDFGKRGASFDLSSLLQISAQPNPTRATTTISYRLPADTRVTLSLYDAAGRLVRNLVPESVQSAGLHTIEWDGTAANGDGVPSGAYFYRVVTSDGVAQGQITVAR